MNEKEFVNEELAGMDEKQIYEEYKKFMVPYTGQSIFEYIEYSHLEALKKFGDREFIYADILILYMGVFNYEKTEQYYEIYKSKYRRLNIVEKYLKNPIISRCDK